MAEYVFLWWREDELKVGGAGVLSKRARERERR